MSLVAGVVLPPLVPLLAEYDYSCCKHIKRQDDVQVRPRWMLSSKYKISLMVKAVIKGRGFAWVDMHLSNLVLLPFRLHQGNEMEKKDSTATYKRRIVDFYRAPCVRFAYSAVSHLITSSFQPKSLWECRLQPILPLVLQCFAADSLLCGSVGCEIWCCRASMGNCPPGLPRSRRLPTFLQRACFAFCFSRSSKQTVLMPYNRLPCSAISKSRAIINRLRVQKGI